MKNYVVKYAPEQKYLKIELGKANDKFEDYLTDDISRAVRFNLLSSLEQMAEWTRSRDLGPLNTKSEYFLRKIFLQGSFVEVEDQDTPEFLERVRQFEEASHIRQ